MKNNLIFLLLTISLLIDGFYNPITANNIASQTKLVNEITLSDYNKAAKEQTTEWRNYGRVNALVFGGFDWLACIGDALKYDRISERFFELEEEGGHLGKPHTYTIDIQYRYINGDIQYRMSTHKGYAYFSLNPHTTIEYIIDNNNYPASRKKDVSNYSHFAIAYEDCLYFIKMK